MSSIRQIRSLLYVAVPFTILAAGTASAQCPTISALGSGVSVTATTDPRLYSITPGSTHWSAVGVRPADSKNWDMEVRDTTAPFPTCLTGSLGNSALTGIDFMVTDWRFRAVGTDYLAVGTTTQVGTSARVQYEQTSSEEPADNGPSDLIAVAANDVLKMREVTLQVGAHYYIEIVPSVGLSGLKAYVFAPVTAGSGWAGRTDRQVEQFLADGSVNTLDVLAATTGTYGIVITNESATSGSFYLTVKHCPFSSSAMTDNLPRLTVKLDDWPAFVPPAHTWGAVGERGEPGYQYNWDVAPSLRPGPGPNMTCTDSVLASQTSGSGARVIVGDFRANPLRFYTAHSSLELQPSTSALGWREWEDGQDSIVVNAPAKIVTPPANNVLDAWTIRLTASTTYHFHLTPDVGATADYKMLVFANPNPGSAYWATRPQAAAEFQVTGTYTPAVDGTCGLVVLNDNGGTGGYRIIVVTGVTDVGPVGTSASRIRTVAPNPSFAGARIDYDLAAAGRAKLVVTNLAGRAVVEVRADASGAGPGSLAWNGRDARGARPPAGVYFVTLYLGDEPQDRAKLIVLR